MYGYIRPLKAEMKLRDYEAYHAMYCGLCRQLGQQYGFAGRFLVSYDLTFLCCLLAGTAESWKQERCFCPANPVCRKTCVAELEAIEFSADVTILLGWQKLRDTAEDEHGFKKLAARAGSLAFGPAYRKAAKRRPELACQIEQCMTQLSELERTKCASLDEPADAFARLLAACATFVTAEPDHRIIEQLLYHVGRFIYLTDALEDLTADQQKGRYNPILLRYQVGEGEITEEMRRSVMETIDASVSLAAAAMELLPLRAGRDILDNIIYLGMPGVLRAVTAGSFRKQKRGSYL